VQVVLSCIARDVARLSVTDDRDLSPVIHAGTPVTASARPGPLRLAARQWIVPVASERIWTARLAGYEYRLVDAAAMTDLLAYHWHPAGRSHLTAPHLHFGSGLQRALGMRKTVHLPTGTILLRDVVTMLIEEFGARPLRRDWRRILQDTHV
jgi:hypothetical protein